MRLRVTPDVDEVTVLPQVGTAAEVFASPESCFCELLPDRYDPEDPLFRRASSVVAGEVAAPDWWSPRDPRFRALHLFKIRDAYVFPAWGVVATRDGSLMRLTMEEARYDSPNLSDLPGMSRSKGGVVLDVADAVAFRPSAALVMPRGAVGNYGHFVIDALPSLAVLDDIGSLGRFPVLTAPLLPWQARHLALLGAATEETAHPILRVGEVLYTSGMHHFLHSPNLNLRRVAERQIPVATPAASPASRRLYLARGPAKQRAMLSERRLVRTLRRAGFEAIETGRMTVDDQISRFAAAEVVLGTTGAAFANVIYCRPGTRVIEIQPAGMENHWVQGLCLIAGLSHAAYFCVSHAADPRRPEQGLSFDLDLDRFLAFVFALPPLDREPRPGAGSLFLRIFPPKP